MGATYMMGSTYTFATGYTLPEMSIQKGVPYPHFTSVAAELKRKRDFLLSKIMALQNPAIG